MPGQQCPDLSCLSAGLPLSPLPPPRTPSPNVPHAPVRRCSLTRSERRLAVANALRYFPQSLHAELADEFKRELDAYGHIYMYRLMPQFRIKAYGIDCYPARLLAARAVQLMICNNLDKDVAQFPEELVTYGGNGQVFSNWAQFWLTMQYLSELEATQTLSLYSGHPLGSFPSTPSSPRLVVTNGMMVPNYSTTEQYERLFALGVTQFGQMTAGSFCYIGPQGIVHGTTITLLNAGRRLQAAGTDDKSDGLEGKVFVSSGLGGMSGAQPKAATIAKCLAVVAEVSEEALDKRLSQGWISEKVTNLDDVIHKIRVYRRNPQAGAYSIGYHGNVVDLWERLANECDSSGELLADVGSDQTSCHNPWQGGYYPAGVEYSDARQMMSDNPEQFKEAVRASLRRQVAAIGRLADAGMYFFDYGNAFLLQACRAGADVLAEGADAAAAVPKFRYPSYVQHIMGDVFSLGFGPFRWVCASGMEQDLDTTDRIAGDLLQELAEAEDFLETRQQYLDNLRWIREAKSHRLVVGSQARILYSDLRGRVQLAVRFNKAVATGELKGPIVASRDHHDVSGTDSPFRETSNISDGSCVCADMSVQNVIGDACRGATWVSLHNGGGTGWGEAFNGGFGLVLDGSDEAEAAARGMLSWDVANGIARRSWAGHPLADAAIARAETQWPGLRVTRANRVEDFVLDKVVG